MGFTSLKNGLDVTVYAKPEFDWGYMYVIRLAMENNHHTKLLELLKSAEYSYTQLNEIRLGLEVGIDVDKYAKVEYPPEFMRRIRMYITNGLSPDTCIDYYKKGFDMQQIDVILEGEKAGVDVSLYANVTCPAERMLEILTRLINMKM